MGFTKFFQHGLVDADRRVEAMDVAWLVVELIGNRIKLRLAVNRQIGALGQVLPDRSVVANFWETGGGTSPPNIYYALRLPQSGYR
jgi:hypothetical protein